MSVEGAGITSPSSWVDLSPDVAPEEFEESATLGVAEAVDGGVLGLGYGSGSPVVVADPTGTVSSTRRFSTVDGNQAPRIERPTIANDNQKPTLERRLLEGFTS